MRVLLLYAPRMNNVAALYDAPDTPSALTRPLILALVAAESPRRPTTTWTATLIHTTY
jgi:hypothetical protein